ncbi:Gfo/Idh/MocA family protein [Patulibacter sp. S7RM1-6]
MAEIRIALAGFGRFARLHARAFAAVDGCRVVAVCDPDPAARAAVAPLLGDDVAVHADLGALLAAEPDLHAVDVLSDEASHGAQALAALDRGLAVFAEKPLATDPAQAREIARRAERRGLPVVVGYVSRFDPRYATVRRAIELGRLGRVCAVTGRRGFSRRWFAGFGSRVHPVFESMIHDIDVALWFLDAPIATVYARELASSGGVPDVLSALLTAADGRIVSLQSSWLAPDGEVANLPGPPLDPLGLVGTIDAQMEVAGTGGSARVVVDDGTRIVTDDGAVAPQALWADVHGRVDGALRAELEHFVACVRDGRPSELVPVAAAAHHVAVADAIVRSAAAGTPVAL